MPWYFESLDAKSGQGFIQFSDTAANRDSTTEVETIYVGPPDFTPVAGVSPSTAMAATRGSFQHRLYSQDGKREVSFDTLEAAISFLRRAYLSAGGGPTGDDGTGPSPSEGPRPGEPGGGMELLQALRDVFSSFRELPPENFDATFWNFAKPGFERDWIHLSSYALDFLATQGYAQNPRSQGEIRSRDALVYMASSINLDIDVDWFPDEPYPPWWCHRLAAARTDPMDLLAALPIPLACSQKFRTAERPSLVDFMSIALAKPEYLADDDPAICLLILIAAYLNASELERFSFNSAALGRKAATWLVANLPDHIYDQDTETLIGDANKLSYFTT